MQDEAAQLWSRLDNEQSVLAEALRKKLDGHEDAALDIVVNHFRRRDTPTYLFSEMELDTFYDDEIVGEANAICDGWILGHLFREGIDWKFNATASTTRDGEWMWSLARHQWWIVLGRAFRQTRDEKYAREAISQLKSFRTAWPMEPFLEIESANMVFPGDAWRSIEAAIRIYTVWLPFYYYFRDSTSWDIEGWISYLNGIYDHATYLSSHLTRYSRCPNWMAMESSSLFQVGLMFPEFKDSSDWKTEGWQNVCQESCYQFDQDGVHMERTPIYHLVSLIAVFQAWKLAKLNNIKPPPYMLTVVEKGTNFLMGLIKPDLSLPMIGDADRVTLTSRRADSSIFEGMNLTTDPFDLNEVRAHFRKTASLCGRIDFSYFATARNQGRSPEQLDYLLPEAGYFAVRSGWNAEDSYLLLTGIQLERGSNCAHSHRDAGHVEYSCLGEDVLVDAGRYLYGNCEQLDWWQYFASTPAHNTVGVDRFPMGHLPGQEGSATGYSTIRNIRTLVHETASTPEYSIVDISHNGYSFLIQPVFCRRRILFFRDSGAVLIEDRLTGAGEHEYNLYFNFAPGKLTQDDKEEHVYHFQRGKLQDMICRPLLVQGLSSRILEGSDEPKGGWISYAYSTKEIAPQLIYSVIGSTPRLFHTLLYPAGILKKVITTLDVDETRIILSFGDQEYTVVSTERLFNCCLWRS